jgi:hypothetical protein
MEPYAGVDYKSITSPYVYSRVDSNTFTMGTGQPYARVDLNPMPELTLSQSGTLDLASKLSILRSYSFSLTL